MIVEVCTTDDWIDIFFDSRRVYGGHSISPSILLALISRHVPDIQIRPIFTWEYTDEQPSPTLHGVTLGEHDEY